MTKEEIINNKRIYDEEKIKEELIRLNDEKIKWLKHIETFKNEKLPSDLNSVILKNNLNSSTSECFVSSEEAEIVKEELIKLNFHLKLNMYQIRIMVMMHHLQVLYIL